MPTLRTAPRCLVIATLLAAAPFAVPVEADDGRGRSGFYVGGHVGTMFGGANATLTDDNLHERESVLTRLRRAFD